MNYASLVYCIYLRGGFPLFISQGGPPYIFLSWGLVEEEVFWLGQSARSTLPVGLGRPTGLDDGSSRCRHVLVSRGSFVFSSQRYPQTSLLGMAFSVGGGIPIEGVSFACGEPCPVALLA